MTQQSVNAEYQTPSLHKQISRHWYSRYMCLQTNGGLDRPQLYINLVPAEINRLLIVRSRQPASYRISGCWKKSFKRKMIFWGS